MDKEQAEEFTETVDQIGTAWYRQVLWAGENGVPQALGYKVLEEWVQARLGGYRKYAVKDRRRIVMELTQEGKSQRDIAAVLGVHHDTIAEDQKVVGNPTKNTSSSGKSVGNPTTANSRTKRDAHPESEPVEEPSNMVNRLRSLSGEVEWYTPEKYLDSVRKVLGVIELDPASSKVAQQLVKAEDYYDQAQNGLTKSWKGKVFLNPPYAMPAIRDFVEHMVEEFSNGNVTEGILLTNAATDTQWYDIAMGTAQAKCDTRGRISFLGNVQGEFLECTSPACGQTFFYFGKRRDKFAKEFNQWGRILIELK